MKIGSVHLSSLAGAAMVVALGAGGLLRAQDSCGPGRTPVAVESDSRNQVAHEALPLPLTPTPTPTPTLLSLSPSADQQPPPPVDPTAPARPSGAVPEAMPFRQVASNVFELGKVTLDKKQRTVSFPVAVNMRGGVVEYAVVTREGKTHESVFLTDTQPQHIHLAMLLLGALLAATNAFPADLDLPVPGERVTIEVSWRSAGRERRRPLEDFIRTSNNGRPLSQGPWIYNGSFVWDGRFLAQQDGSIVSLHIDPGALVNNPRSGRENDDLHHVNGKALPPDGTPLRVTIKLETKPAARADEQAPAGRRP